MQTIKAVIFDLDGTLVDTIPLCITCFRQALEPIVHRSLSDEEIIAAFGPDEEGTIKKFTSDYKKATDDFMWLYESLHDMCTAPFEGITELLETLKEKGIKLALATGKGKQTTQLTLQLLCLTPFFDAVETGSPKGSRKPEAIQQIIDSFTGVTKEEVIYIGDSKGDITDSRKAGIAVAAAAWADTVKMKEIENEKPDEIFTSVAAFKDWIMTKI